MWSGMLVVRTIPFDQPLETGHAEHDDVIETLASNGSDEPVGVRMLPRRTRCGEDFLDAQGLRRLCPSLEGIIAVSDQVSRRSVPGDCFAHLVNRPRRGGMLRDAHVYDAPALMGEDHEHERQAVRGGRDHEEIGSHDLVDVIGEKRSPRRRRRAPPPRHVRRDCGLTDVDPELY
jgi:hypothetical protein